MSFQTCLNVQMFLQTAEYGLVSKACFLVANSCQHKNWVPTAEQVHASQGSARSSGSQHLRREGKDGKGDWQGTGRDFVVGYGIVQKANQG